MNDEKLQLARKALKELKFWILACSLGGFLQVFVTVEAYYSKSLSFGHLILIGLAISLAHSVSELTRRKKIISRLIKEVETT